MDLDGVSHALGYRFNDSGLLRRALTHRSHSADHNERLEYLGDSVVNCAIALALYRKFPEAPEGDLSRLRASLVSQPALAGIALDLGLGGHLALGEGELRSNGRERPSILADALEAVIGATLLDGGFDAAAGVVGRLFRPALDATQPDTTGKDPKTLLQELLQGRRIALPQYRVVATRGSAHAQIFEVECAVAALSICCRGEGASRRAAEQNAARAAYALAAPA